MPTDHSENRNVSIPRQADAPRIDLSRRGVLAAALGTASGMLWGASPTVARAESASAGDVENMETSAEFNGPYTAWRGYASTARHGIVPGAVPVKAPASDEVLWSARVAGATGAAALRQSGQATYLYAVAGDYVVQLDAETGEEVRSVKLLHAPLEGACPVFAGAAFGVALEGGRVQMLDEELNTAWLSDPIEPPAALDLAAGGEGVRFAASKLVAAGGAVHMAYLITADGATATIVLVSLAEIDGSLLWSAELSCPAVSLGAGMVAPEVLLVDDGSDLYLLVADGSETLCAVSVATGGVVSRLKLGAAVRGRIAEMPMGLDGERAWVVGDDAGTVSVVTVSHGELAVRAESPVVSSPDGPRFKLLPCAPAVARGHAFFWAEPDAPGGTGVDAREAFCLDVTVAEVGTGSVGAVLAGAAPRSGSVPLLPVTYGDNAREAAVSLYALRADAGVAAFECDAVPVRHANLVPAVWCPEDAFAGMSAIKGAQLLVNRDGTLIVPVVFSGGEAGFVALAPDESRAAATPVGGSEGIDTLASTLSGLKLPNGAGVGVGALVLAATFGAYAYIRNGGGRSRRDEGVDEWRAEHSDDGRSAGADERGGRW